VLLTAYGQKRVEMRSSDKQSQVEQALPTTAPLSVFPEPAPNAIRIPEIKQEVEHPTGWPVNPKGSRTNPMFARAIFPRSSFIGPVPLVTSGQGGLVPNGRKLRKADTAMTMKAKSDQASLMAGVLAALQNLGAPKAHISL
jgi:hypothetical protein